MTIKTIDVGTLRDWLDNASAVLVDVREVEEHAAKSIPAAKLIPLAKLCENTLPNITNKKLVLHCGGGGRGGRACEKLIAENPNLEVYNLKGGLRAWAAAGYEVNEGIQGNQDNFCTTKK